MGCSSGNDIEENQFPKTGDPKRDFFYCFDDQEVKIIEERKKLIESPPEEDYTDLYSRFEIDYINEKDENLILKQYIAVYIKEDYVGLYVLDDVRFFQIKACDILEFKINEKKATLPEFKLMDDWTYCRIKGQISGNDHVEPFKDLLIFEITYKIKQFNVYNTRFIFIERPEKEVYSASLIIYFDNNKEEVQINGENNCVTLKNGFKYFNQRQIYLFIRNKEKIKFSKEEEALIKQKFTSEEISNIYAACDKIGALKDNSNLIFETFKYIFNNEGICKGEGKMLVITNERFCEQLVGYGSNFTITEIKINDKLIEKVPSDFLHKDHPEIKKYFISNNGNCITYFSEIKPLLIIEFKIELVPPKNEEGNEEDEEEEEDERGHKYPFDYAELFGVDYHNGGYYNIEIVPNGAKLIFEPDEERFTPKKTENSIIYSGFYNVNPNEYDDIQYLKETGQEYENYEEIKNEKHIRFSLWELKKLRECHPLKFQIE